MQESKPCVKTYIFDEPQEFMTVWERQKKWVEEINQQEREQSLLLLEHFPIYTLGRGAKEAHLLITREACLQQGIQVLDIDRGGDITYHGPGQLVGYPLLNLAMFNFNAHQYLRSLEEALIKTLAYYGISASRKLAYTGVWVNDRKIAAIGIKFNRGRHSKAFITSHGFALNISTDLSYFDQIVPCGISEYGVTSMEMVTKKKHQLREVAQVYAQFFYNEFGVKACE